MRSRLQSDRWPAREEDKMGSSSQSPVHKQMSENDEVRVSTDYVSENIDDQKDEDEEEFSKQNEDCFIFS